MKERTKDFADDDLKKKIADYEIELSALEFTELRTLAALANGGHPGAESSIIKIKGTELQQRLTEMYVEAAGQYILPYEGQKDLIQIILLPPMYLILALRLSQGI